MIKFLSGCLILAALIFSPAFQQASAQGLPPEVKFDLLSRQVEVFLERDQHEEAIEALKQMRALNLPVDFSITFYEGKLLFESGEFAEAEQVLLDYLVKTGRTGEHYEEAIDLVVWSREEQLVQRDAEQQAEEKEALAAEKAETKAQMLEEQVTLLEELTAEQRMLGKWVLTRQQQCGTCQGCTSRYDDTHNVYDECRGLFSVDFRQCAVKVREHAQLEYKRDCRVELPREQNRLRTLTEQINNLQTAIDAAQIGEGFLP
ncbi:hypothetical protein ACTL6U_20590 [Rhodovibrionaceae bacterium A322]